MSDASEEIFEERAAICEYDGGLTRKEAEEVAAIALGYPNAEKYREDMIWKTK